jgi:hypothetical protein
MVCGDSKNLNICPTNNFSLKFSTEIIAISALIVSPR